MDELPTGTVTFLFTDVEGSTRLLDKLGADRYAEALSEHRRVLRAAIAAHGGVEVDTQGDAFFVAFASAEAAVGAAREAQAGLTGPVRVRMGLHSGEPLVTREGYVGMDVHRGARIAAAAHGGQVLVSAATRHALVSGTVPGTELRDLGEQRLKDLGAPVRLFQLGAGEFPPLKVLYWSTLPVQPAPLVGRARELAEAGALLRNRRLVTLSGPGGSGKTRLALQLAAEGADDFVDGVYWVPLQALRDPSLVLPSIAQAIDAKGELAEHIADKRMLVLLDNMEHLLASAPMLAELLARAPNLKLLATSREPLRIVAEVEYPVEPLPIDDAVTLFVERAAQAEPLDAVEAVCRRVDCLPLAVELAAARTTLLRPDALLARLERALPLLTGGARDAPERQRTLHATIEWSHELLSPDERQLFGRLSVFAGSFTLEAAEQVVAAEPDLLQSLIEKSLLRRWESGRYGMLETIHEFAREQLAVSAERARVGGSHARHFFGLARPPGHAPERARPEDGWFDSIQADYENVRAALDWLRTDGRSTEVVQLVVSLVPFWLERGFWAEAAGAIDDALLLDVADQRLRAMALLGAVEFALRLGADGARGRADEAVMLADRVADDELRALALNALGNVEAETDVEAARRAYERAAVAARRAGAARAEAAVLGNQGYLLLAHGEIASAMPVFEETVASAERLGDESLRTVAIYNLAFSALGLHRIEEARPLLAEALSAARRLEVREGIPYGLAGAAVYAAMCDRPRVAARLLGAAARESAELGLELSVFEQGLVRDAQAAIAACVDSEARTQTDLAGRAWSTDDAVDEALRVLADR